jgi:hypothetical protein
MMAILMKESPTKTDPMMAIPMKGSLTKTDQTHLFQEKGNRSMIVNLSKGMTAVMAMIAHTVMIEILVTTDLMMVRDRRE